MDEKDFELLNNDLRVLFQFIKNSGDENKLNYLILNKKLVAKNETIRLINEITKAELPMNDNEEDTEMCKAIEDMKKHAREDGIQEGIAKGEEKNLNNNIKTMHSNGADETLIAKLLNLDINYVKKVLA